MATSAGETVSGTSAGLDCRFVQAALRQPLMASADCIIILVIIFWACAMLERFKF